VTIRRTRFDLASHHRGNSSRDDSTDTSSDRGEANDGTAAPHGDPSVSGWIYWWVTKRLIDIDDDKLDAVRAVLGTRTLKATVSEALDDVLKLDRRRRALLAEREMDDALSDPGARLAAWG
jgi:Arc/MetJ family transcription regulator